MAAREVLRRELPALEIHSVEPLGEGWDHVAFLVNGEIVFRLPWEMVEPEGDPQEMAGAAAEVELLRRVAGRVPIATPEPLFVAAGSGFFGYRYLPGLSVVDGLERWKAPAELARLAEVVTGVVLAVEGTVTVPEGTRIGLQYRDAPLDHAGAARALDLPLVSPAVRSMAQRVLDEYPERWKRAAARRMTVLHGDLGLDHWLVDTTGAVYALIDWSDASIAPPEHQLSTLMWDIPELTWEVTTRYTDATGDRPDRDLTFSDGYLNALGDVGELVAEDERGEELDRCLRFLSSWTERGLS